MSEKLLEILSKSIKDVHFANTESRELAQEALAEYNAHIEKMKMLYKAGKCSEKELEFIYEMILFDFKLKLDRVAAIDKRVWRVAINNAVEASLSCLDKAIAAAIKLPIFL